MERKGNGAQGRTENRPLNQGLTPVWGSPQAVDFPYRRRSTVPLPRQDFCRAYVAEVAAEFLPRVLAQMGVGQLLGRISPIAKQIVGSRAPMAALPLDPAGRWLLLRLVPDSTDLLAMDEWSHRWRCPSLVTLGQDLIDLGAWRWQVPPATAALRIVRACGREWPRP